MSALALLAIAGHSPLELHAIAVAALLVVLRLVVGDGDELLELALELVG